MKAWKLANPDRKRELNRRWAEGNREKARQSARDYNRRNRETVNTRARTWAAMNPERVRLRARRYYARHRVRKAAEQRMRRMDETTRQFALTLAADPCSYCAGPCENFDHIEPLAVGGPTHWENLTAACESCNKSKRDRPLLTYLLYRKAAV